MLHMPFSRHFEHNALTQHMPTMYQMQLFYLVLRTCGTKQ